MDNSIDMSVSESINGALQVLIKIKVSLPHLLPLHITYSSFLSPKNVFNIVVSEPSINNIASMDNIKLHFKWSNTLKILAGIK